MQGTLTKTDRPLYDFLNNQIVGFEEIAQGFLDRTEVGLRLYSCHVKENCKWWRLHVDDFI